MLCSAERRQEDLPTTKQTNPETDGRGDQGERQGEEVDKSHKNVRGSRNVGEC